VGGRGRAAAEDASGGVKASERKWREKKGKRGWWGGGSGMAAGGGSGDGRSKKKTKSFFFELGCQCELLLKRSCPTHSCNEEASGESIFSPFLLLLY
jgi:hypothetical protein